MCCACIAAIETCCIISRDTCFSERRRQQQLRLQRLSWVHVEFQKRSLECDSSPEIYSPERWCSTWLHACWRGCYEADDSPPLLTFSRSCLSCLVRASREHMDCCGATTVHTHLPSPSWAELYTCHDSSGFAGNTWRQSQRQRWVGGARTGGDRNELRGVREGLHSQAPPPPRGRGDQHRTSHRQVSGFWCSSSHAAVSILPCGAL